MSAKIITLNSDPQHLSLEVCIGTDQRGNKIRFKYNWSTQDWTDLYLERRLSNAEMVRMYGIDAVPIVAAIEIREAAEIEAELSDVTDWLTEGEPRLSSDDPKVLERDREMEIQSARYGG